jgi:hypothetical protein
LSIEALEQQRRQGTGAYPLTLAQLPALVGAEKPAQIGKALDKKPFAARFAVTDKNRPTARSASARTPPPWPTDRCSCASL